MEIFLGAFTSDWERQRVAILHDALLGRPSSDATEEDDPSQRLRAPGGGGGKGGARARAVSKSAPGSKASSRPMQQRLTGVARGSQPAVVKLASYGGGARLGAMMDYVSRGGELGVEDETGQVITGREEMAALRGEWDERFGNRQESRDIAPFTVEIRTQEPMDDDHMDELVRDVVASGFGDRSFAYGVTRHSDNTLTVDGLVVLRSGQGERLTADQKATELVQKRFNESSAAATADAGFGFHGHGNGVTYGTLKLRDLVDRHEGDVRDDRGRLIDNDEAAGDLVQKEWRQELHSRKPRDVMHVIMSARAGTDAEAFRNAARDFLAEQFAGHRYVFAMHDPQDDPKAAGEGGKRPHVHAHAIITMQHADGHKVDPKVDTFREWRETMAEKARAHGIDMEMTDRREFAAAPAYSKNQVRPISHDGRTEHQGTTEAGQRRYNAKRRAERSTASTVRSRAYIAEASQTWRQLAMASGDRQVVSYAIQQRERIRSANEEGRAVQSDNVVGLKGRSEVEANLVKRQEEIALGGEGGTMKRMTRSEFETYEKKVETALFNFQRTLGPEDRETYEEIAAKTRIVVDIRREALERQERESGDRRDEGATEADWQAAVEKHGEAAVEAGSEALNRIYELEVARADLDRPEPVHDPETGAYTYEMSEQDRQNIERLRAESDGQLQSAIEHAARLAVAGNSFVREAAQDDPELAKAIETAEMAEKPVQNRFRLLEAHSENVGQYATAGEAGRAFADADPNMRPYVVEQVGEGARIMARTVQVGDEIQKSVSSVEQVRNDPANYDANGQPNEMHGRSNIDFWTAYHEREAEKEREGQRGRDDNLGTNKDAARVSAEKSTGERQDRNEGETRSDTDKNTAPSSGDPAAERYRNPQHEAGRDQPSETDEREAQELAQSIDAVNRLRDKVERDKQGGDRSQEKARTDPPQQHVRRIEDIEREIRDRERDRDDRER